MRKIALLVGIAGLLVLLPSVASAGPGTPTRVPATPADATFDYPAGTLCSFELAGKPVALNAKTATFPPKPNGDVVSIETGTLKEQLTNVGTGKSIVANLSGGGSFTTHPDGSVTIVGHGPALLTDFTVPAAYLFTGRYVVNLTASGQVSSYSQTGHQVDLCAMLS